MTPEDFTFKAQCPVHGLRTFVWNEGALWWHCDLMYVRAVDPARPDVVAEMRACQSVLPQEDLTPDGGEIIQYPHDTTVTIYHLKEKSA